MDGLSLRYATVTEITNDNRVHIRLNGEELVSQVSYYYLESYTARVNDVVLVDTKLKIVIGKVVL